MMRRRSIHPVSVLLSALLAVLLIGCARQDAPAPVTYHGNAGVPPPAYAPPPYRAPPPVASRAAPPPSSASPRYAAPARPTPRPAEPSPTTAAVPPPEPPPQSHPDKILVVDGDTIWSVSRRHGVPVRSIIDANHLKPPYRLVSGSIVILPQVRQHTVRPGETLYSISRLYGVDTSTLVSLNHMEPPYNVKLDTVMVIPPPVEGGRAVAEARTPSPPLSASGPRLQTPPPPTAIPPAESVAAVAPMPAMKPDRAPPANPPPAAPDAEPAALPPPLPGGKGFVWPVEGRVLGTYGEGPGGTHNDGINIAAPEGTPVVAAEAGVVAYTGNELRGYGNLVLIKHAGGWMTAYAHNQTVLVKRGDTVRRGQMIARVGATGAVGEPQLHFEMRRGTRALDPTAYLPAMRATAVNE